MMKIIQLIEEKLNEQERAIDIKAWEIADLRSKLENAEEEIKRLRGEISI